MIEPTTDAITSKEQLRNNLYLKAVNNARMEFFSFVRFIAPQLVPDFKVGKHIEVLSSKLQTVVDSPDPLFGS